MLEVSTLPSRAETPFVRGLGRSATSRDHSGLNIERRAFFFDDKTDDADAGGGRGRGRGCDGELRLKLS